ncbi:hypothetical protein TNCV_1310321 [Trichonephila clavipes]|nr:hypothetical protein TNCV_1310321 [Trichonephila clavipes]
MILKGNDQTQVRELSMSSSSARAVGSLVVRAADSGPPNTLRVHTEYVLVKSVGPKVMRAESRVQGTGENFPRLQFHA